MDSSNPFANQDTFEDQQFSACELNGADLSNRDFIRCTFRKMLLQDTLWQKTRLEDCVFEDCDLTRLRPTALELRNVDFIGCRLTGVDWTDIAPNPTLSFDRCNLQYASFVSVNLTGAKFLHCRLVEVNFVEARLPHADFSDSGLSGSTFDRCDLRHADFSATHGLFLDPARNRIRDARINVAAAVLLAASLGLRVSGFDEENAEPTRRISSSGKKR